MVSSTAHLFDDIKIAANDFKRLMMGLADAPTLLTEGKLIIEGDLGALAQMAGLFDQFERQFPIVTPRDAW